MIEIKSVRDVTLDSEVLIPYTELQELIDYKIKSLKVLGALKTKIFEKYVENRACFGNGGAFTCEELADLLCIDLPAVPHIGMDEWLKIKKGAEEIERRKDNS